MADDLATQLRDELARLLAPLAAAAAPGGAANLLAALGRPDNDDAVRAELQRLTILAAGIAALDGSALTSWDGLQRLLSLSQELLAALRGIEGVVSDPDVARQLEGLGVELTELITGQYLRAEHPRIHRAACVLTLVDPDELDPPTPVVADDGVVVRLPWLRDRLHFERLPSLIDDPFGTLRAAYLPNGLAAAADAHQSAQRIFPLLRELARILGLSSSDGPFDPAAPPPPEPPTSDEVDVDDPDLPPPPEPAEDPPPPDPVDLTAFQHTYFPRLLLALPGLPTSDGAPSPLRLGCAVLVSSAEHAGGVRGLLLTPTGELNWTELRGSWQLTMTADGQIPAFVIGPGSLAVAPSDGPITRATATLTIGLVAAPGAPAFRLGSATSTRLELGTVQIGIGTDIGTDHQSIELSAETTQAVLVLTAGDGDGFLSAVLPAGGIRANLDFGIILSSESGLHLKGGVGLATSFPISVTVGPARLDSISLAVTTTGGVALEATAAVSVQIGPVTASIGGAGLRLAVSFPSGGGNLGPVDLDPGFKPPSDIGLSVDAQGVLTGGGFLAFDPEHGQYAGEVHLQFEGIAVRATGLLTTRLPDGKPGFSLLVIVSAEFPPVQLGLGFMLVGVGGLLGINRTAAVEALRAGLKTGALGAVLSPPDPKASAGQIVAGLAGLFPPAAGRHVFGPTARIVWGSPTLITIELALVLELPAPVRLVVLGRLRAVLPDEDEAIVRIQVDMLGVIDFGRGEAAVDATLVDSRLAQFALTGDMALRMSWGEEPTFLLAVGGFHPRFAAPRGFPALERVAVALAAGDNPKLRLEAYLALTSNTVQFGARIDLGARAGSFSIAGFLSFDALVTLAPLAFVADIAAKLAVKAGGHTILSVSLDLTLSGPRPWRARGRASFSILFFDVSFGFDVTIGDDAAPVLPAPVDVAVLLVAAFADARSWHAQLPAGGAALVTLRVVDPGSEVLAHPLATLQVRQRVAPLERTLDRFGTTVPSGARRFKITLATIGGVRTTLTGLQDRFAPAQFAALSDDDRLSSPSFEDMPSGAALGADGYATGAPVSLAVVYEQLLVTAPGVPEPKSQRVSIPGDVFAALTAGPPARAPAFALRDGP